MQGQFGLEGISGPDDGQWQFSRLLVTGLDINSISSHICFPIRSPEQFLSLQFTLIGLVFVPEKLKQGFKVNIIGYESIRGMTLVALWLVTSPFPHGCHAA